MNDIFKANLLPISENLFYKTDDRTDLRLGNIIPKTTYDEAKIVIVGCPQDEGARRAGGQTGSADAPAAIREQFYKLTPFGISLKICDLGNIVTENKPLEEIHENLREIAKRVISDGKKLIVIGGANDISYPNGKAMAESYGKDNWLGVNISSRFDVFQRAQIDSGSAYRRILEENLIRPHYLYQIGYQTHFSSPAHYQYLQDLRVNLSSLEQIRSRETADLELREMMRERFVHHSQSLNIFFGFSMTVVRSSDAPGSNFPGPLGLRAGEFITLIKFAASLANTRIIQFTDVNPKFDVVNRTSELVAIAIHRFCSNAQGLK